MTFALLKEPFTFYRGSNLIDVSEDNPLPVVERNIFDDGNSTTTALAANDSFVGTGVLLEERIQINVTIITDKPSAVNGMRFQYSPDNVTWFDGTEPFTHSGTDSTRLTDDATAGVRTFQLEISGKYFRVKYQNGSENQGTFIVQTILLGSQSNKTTHKLEGSLGGDRSVEVIKSVISGRTPDGGYVNQKVGGLDSSNSTQVAPTNTTLGNFTVDDTNDLIQIVGHGLTDGDVVVFSTTDTLPKGLFINVLYHVRNSNVDDFQVSTTATGNIIDITSTGTGTHTAIIPGSFLGEYQATEGMASALVFIVSDKKITHAELDYSPDGTNPRTGLLASTAFLDSEYFIQGFYIYLSLVTTFVDKYTRLHLRTGSEQPTIFETDIWFYDKPYTGSFVSLSSELSALSLAQLTRSVVAGVRPDGGFENVAIDDSRRLKTALSGRTTQSGEILTAFYTKDISLEFVAGADGDDAISTLVDGGTTAGGMAVIDQVEGGAVFTTASDPGSKLIKYTDTSVSYESSDDIKGDHTLATTLNHIVGDAEVRIGFMKISLGEIVNGIGWGVGVDPDLGEPDVFVWRRKNGIDKLLVWRKDFNRDVFDGGIFSGLFNKDGPVALNPENTYRFYEVFPWLGIGPPDFGIGSVRGEEIPAHMEELPGTQNVPSLPNPRLPLGIYMKNDSTVGGLLECRSGSWNAGTARKEIALSGIGEDGIRKSIGVDGFGASQNNYITGVNPVAEIKTNVKTFDPELELEPNNQIETFQFNVVSGTSTELPLPTKLSRVRGVEFTNTGDEDTLYYREIDSNITGQGNLVISGQTKEKHYGNKNGLTPSQINPLYFQASGVSNSSEETIAATAEAANNGVTPTNVMYAEDSTFADFDALSDSVTLGSFNTAPINQAVIANVKIHVNGKKEAGAPGEISAVGVANALSGTSSTSITTQQITADPDKTLLVFFARRNVDSILTNVTNTMGYSGFTQIDLGGENLDVNNGLESRMSAVIMTGTPTQNGTVSGIVNTPSDHEVAGYVYLENVKTTGINVDTYTTDTANNPAGSVSATGNGTVILAIASEGCQVQSLDVNYTELAEAGSTLNNDQMLNISHSFVSTTGAKAWSATMDTANDISAVALSFQPADATNPEFQITNNKGDLVMNFTLTSETANHFYFDITSQIANWAESDLSTMELTITPTKIGNAMGQIDVVDMKVVQSGASILVTGEWIGDAI